MSSPQPNEALIGNSELVVQFPLLFPTSPLGKYIFRPDCPTLKRPGMPKVVFFTCMDKAKSQGVDHGLAVLDI